MTNQQQQIIDYCERFGSITNIEAMKELGMCDFRKRLSELRAMGYVFTDITVPNKNNNGYHKKYFYGGKRNG